MSKSLPMAEDHPDARTDLEGWAAYAREKLDGRPIIVSVSGGKDSTATGLLMKEAGLPFTNTHMDTGHEHPWTVKYVLEYLPTVLGPITVLRSKLGTFEDLVRHWRMFPNGRRKFCTKELKMVPFRDHLRGLQSDGLDPVAAIGIRREESRSRSQLSEWEWNEKYDCDVWRPLINWREQDVIDIHLRMGVTPNALYTKLGARRVGCWPCIFVSKDDIRMLAAADPERIEYLAALERDVVDLSRAHYATKGETFESLGYEEPTFFENPRHAKSVADSVAWSKTKRGGKQLDMFTPDYAQEGCMRWGLCS